jgi:hypothetical protein
MVAGGKMYRLAVVTPGFVLGTMVGKSVTLTGDPMVATVIIVIAGLGGAILFHYMERIAVAVIGALVGAHITGAVWPLLAGTAPWWGVLVGSIVGSLAFPKFFRMLLLPITAIIGAVVLASCFAHGQNIFVIGGLALIGAIFQSTVL